MEDSKEILKQEIKAHFSVDARRVDLLTRLLVALLQVCTVSYAQLALALNAKGLCCNEPFFSRDC